MKKFMVHYLIAHEELEKMQAETKPEDWKESMDAWNKWLREHKDIFVDNGTMLGKTKRVTTSGVEDVHNDLTGYAIIEAESHEAAAKIFEGQPHLQMPGASIEIMTMTEMSET
ncbi:hypothetical protein HY374_03795 [Candidatus Berkelbacteria bacterium]|nr:hypothetical protein [Candidatus Berkelbacteria bacterium]